MADRRDISCKSCLLSLFVFEVCNLHECIVKSDLKFFYVFSFRIHCRWATVWVVLSSASLLQSWFPLFTWEVFSLAKIRWKLSNRSHFWHHVKQLKAARSKAVTTAAMENNNYLIACAWNAIQLDRSQCKQGGLPKETAQQSPSKATENADETTKIPLHYHI